MNKKALWITIIAVVVIGVLVYKGGIVSRESGTKEMPYITTTFYDQTTGESTEATFTKDSVTFSNAKLGTMTLPQAVSASGARYANADESIVFWNKGDSVFITQNGKIVFNGSTGKPVGGQGKLPAGSQAPGDPKALIGTWIWQQTVMRDAPVITPKKAGIFTVTFGADGKLSGTTDCNNFGSEYKVASDGIMTFGPFASTLKFCADAQEAVFTSQLMSISRYSFDVDGNLIINVDNDAGSMIFKKK